MKISPRFVLWMFLIVLWNFGIPNARPISDVLVALALFVLFNNLEKIK